MEISGSYVYVDGRADLVVLLAHRSVVESSQQQMLDLECDPKSAPNMRWRSVAESGAHEVG